MTRSSYVYRYVVIIIIIYVGIIGSRYTQYIEYIYIYMGAHMHNIRRVIQLRLFYENDIIISLSGRMMQLNIIQRQTTAPRIICHLQTKRL